MMITLTPDVVWTNGWCCPTDTTADLSGTDTLILAPKFRRRSLQTKFLSKTEGGVSMSPSVSLSNTSLSSAALLKILQVLAVKLFLSGVVAVNEVVVAEVVAVEVVVAEAAVVEAVVAEVDGCQSVICQVVVC
jgi:hypothetical protein